MEPGPALLVIVLAVVPAIAAVLTAAMVVRRARDTRIGLRQLTARLDAERERLVGGAAELRRRTEAGRAAVARLAARSAALDDQQQRWGRELAARRQRMERMTEDQVLPVVRWLRRLGLLFRLIRLRRDVFG